MRRTGRAYGSSYEVEVFWGPVGSDPLYGTKGYTWEVVRNERGGGKTRIYAKRGVIRRNSTGSCSAVTEQDADAVMMLLTGRA